MAMDSALFITNNGGKFECYTLTQRATSDWSCFCAVLARITSMSAQSQIFLSITSPVNCIRYRTQFYCVASDKLNIPDVETNIYQKGQFTMSLIRYQSPELSTWPALSRWADLRDELNSLFDLPTTGTFSRQAQLFGGWTPALDLYQNH